MLAPSMGPPWRNVLCLAVLLLASGATAKKYAVSPLEFPATAEAMEANSVMLGKVQTWLRQFGITTLITKEAGAHKGFSPVTGGSTNSADSSPELLAQKLVTAVGHALGAFFAEDITFEKGTSCPDVVGNETKAFLELVGNELDSVCQDSVFATFCDFYSDLRNVTILALVSKLEINPISLAVTRAAAIADGPCSTEEMKDSTLHEHLHMMKKLSKLSKANALGYRQSKKLEGATVCKGCIKQGLKIYADIVLAKLHFICQKTRCERVKAACKFASEHKYLAQVALLLKLKPWEEVIKACVLVGQCEPPSQMSADTPAEKKLVFFPEAWPFTDIRPQVFPHVESDEGIQKKGYWSSLLSFFSGKSSEDRPAVDSAGVVGSHAFPVPEERKTIGISNMKFEGPQAMHVIGEDHKHRQRHESHHHEDHESNHEDKDEGEIKGHEFHGQGKHPFGHHNHHNEKKEAGRRDERENLSLHEWKRGRDGHHRNKMPVENVYPQEGEGGRVARMLRAAGEVHPFMTGRAGQPFLRGKDTAGPHLRSHHGHWKMSPEQMQELAARWKTRREQAQGEFQRRVHKRVYEGEDDDDEQETKRPVERMGRSLREHHHEARVDSTSKPFPAAIQKAGRNSHKHAWEENPRQHLVNEQKRAMDVEAEQAMIATESTEEGNVKITGPIQNGRLESLEDDDGMVSGGRHHKRHDGRAEFSTQERGHWHGKSGDEDAESRLREPEEDDTNNHHHLHHHRFHHQKDRDFSSSGDWQGGPYHDKHHDDKKKVSEFHLKKHLSRFEDRARSQSNVELSVGNTEEVLTWLGGQLELADPLSEMSLFVDGKEGEARSDAEISRSAVAVARAQASSVVEGRLQEEQKNGDQDEDATVDEELHGAEEKELETSLPEGETRGQLVKEEESTSAASSTGDVE